MSNKILYLLYFLSGFSALVYEIVWLRKLELVFGTTTYAVSTVLAVFFTGLAVGSWGFGKLVDKHNFQFSIFNFQSNSNLKFNKNFIHSTSSGREFQISNLQLYGLLELGIGAYAALTPWIFSIIESVQASFWQSFEPSFAGFSIVTFVLSGIGLLIPTILMGGTFPVIAEAIDANKMRMAIVPINANKKDIRMHSQNSNSHSISIGSIGLLYGLNTLGAVVGTMLAGFFLIATIGVNQTIWVAAFISLVVGGIAIYMSSKFNPSTKLRTRVQS